MAPILRVLSITFLISGFSVMQQAMLERGFEFQKLMKAEIIATAVGSLIGIGVREFSMAAPYIPGVKQMLAKLSTRAAQRIAREVLTLVDGKSTRHLLTKSIARFERSASA